MNHKVLVEVLTASGCGRCRQTKLLVGQIVAEFNSTQIQYREIDVVDEIDYAVKLGVVSTPAIALNRELVFSAQPTPKNLRKAIMNCLEQKE